MPQAFDDAYVQYLLNQGQAPTGPASPLVNEDLYKAQNSWLTGASKGANATTDLDFLMSAGLLAPGAYDPVTTFDPVDAPGYRMLQQWKQGSAYEQYLASQFESGKTANEILTDVQRIVADPGDDPTAQEIAASLPRYYASDQMTGALTATDQPDMRAVGDELRRYESTIMSDPQYTIDPTTGQPVMATTEDSAARKAALDAGYVNTPGVGYDPYSFAPAGTQEADVATLLARKKAAGDWVGASATTAIESAKNQRVQDAYQKFLHPELNTATPAATAENGSIPLKVINAGAGLAQGAVNLVPSPVEALNGGLGFLGGAFHAATHPGDTFKSAINLAAGGPGRAIDAAENVPGRVYGALGGQGSPAPHDPARQAMIDQVMGGMRAGARHAAGVAQGRNYQAHIARRQAEDADIAASDQLVLARRRAAARQALADQLLAQGRSPFQDEVNRRNAAVYGMGM